MSLDVFNSAPGFFGKLPSHGDFIGRGLPISVQDRLDQWLQRGILCGKNELGRHWLPIWLNSPLWRFMLGQGICGDHAWAGVMMPSQDRVGRCFPLLILAEMRCLPTLSDCFGELDIWFAHLEEIALSSLETEYPLEWLEQALSSPGCRILKPISSPVWNTVKYVSDNRNAPIPTSINPDASFGSVWWTVGSPRIPPCVAVREGLPDADLFISLLDGNWEKRGWQEKSQGS